MTYAMRLWDLLLYELQGDTQGSQARGRSGMTSSRAPLLVPITTSLHQHSTSLDLFTSFRVRIPTTYRLCSYLLTHLSFDSSPYFLHLFLGTVCVLCFGEWLKICLWLKLDCTLFGTLLFVGVWLPPVAHLFTRELLIVRIVSQGRHELEWESNAGELGLCPFPATGNQVRLSACLLAFTLLLSEDQIETNTLKLELFPPPLIFFNFAVRLYPLSAFYHSLSH